MGRKRRYKFNRETLAYEVHITSLSSKLSRSSLLFVATLLISFGYYYLYANYLDLDNPKLLTLKRTNQELVNNLELINRRFEKAYHSLHSLEMRDNSLYRPIFGMEEIPKEIRDAGFGGVDRYGYLRNFERSGILSRTAFSIDQLYKRAYIQSRSFDDILQLAHTADEMTLCVPAIPPLNIGDKRVRLAASFGFRKDPFHGNYRMHSGVDLAGPLGMEVVATGNGRVISVSHDLFGYGNFVVVDHGFGYKSRYAHLKSISVTMGQFIKRGEKIGTLGNTGRSTGPHLHYEVIHKNRAVNPLNYYNRDVDEEGFLALINPSS